MDYKKGDVINPHIRAWCTDFRKKINITILKEIVGIKSSVVEELTFKDEDEGTVSHSCMTLGVNQAQILMDDLWECGVRPSEGTGSAGSLKATQNHLADLKTILFHKLGIGE